MNPLNDLCRQLTTLDLTLMVMVEDAVGINRPATPKYFVGLISGATAPKVRERLERLVHLGALEKMIDSYRVTIIGAAALEREVTDWEPSMREHQRREFQGLQAAQVRR